MAAKPIVAGTDGSEESLRAVGRQAGEAILHAVPLRIVSAASLPPVMTALQVRPDRDHVADFIRSERDLALDAAASRAARVAPGLVIVTDPVGRPARAGGHRGAGAGAAMLVVGCRGAAAFTALTLGSVSRYAAAHAVCPVVVVRDLLPAASGLVGVGMDNLEDCADLLTFAFDEASLRKAAVLAIHAWPGSAPESPAAAAAGARLAELIGELGQQAIPRRPRQSADYAGSSGPGPDRPVGPRRPGGHGQAGRASRPARARTDPARRAEPRARPDCRNPVGDMAGSDEQKEGRWPRDDPGPRGPMPAYLATPSARVRGPELWSSTTPWA